MKKIIFFLLITNFAYSQTLVKTYYDPYTKTKLKEVYQVKPNTPIVNGYYKSYDEFGNILVHRNYVNNKQNGKSTAYYGAYEASLMSDEVRDKCLGEISGVFNYKNDKLDGIQLKYDYSKDGVKFLNKKETYSDGVMIKFIEYFPNKQEKKVIQIGKCYEYYEDGSKFAEYTSDGNGQLQGNYTGWRKTGEIEVQGNFFNDEKDGEWIEYYEDGTIKSKELYELGKRLPTQEEKELSRQKEIEKAKKEEEKRKLLEEKRLAEQKEAERIKRIKENC